MSFSGNDEPVNHKVLFVDDDSDTCDLMRTWLSLNGYNVATAPTMFDALELVQSHNFSLYIFDNWLADGSGIELCRQIRAFDRNTPILFVSGAVYQSDIDQALAAGAQAYLRKPVDLTELCHTTVQLIYCHSQVGSTSLFLSSKG